MKLQPQYFKEDRDKELSYYSPSTLFLRGLMIVVLFFSLLIGIGIVDFYGEEIDKFINQVLK